MLTALLDWWSNWWADVEAVLGRLWRRGRRLQDDAADLGAEIQAEVRELGADVERLGEEALGLARGIWDRVDDLPFVPKVFGIPPVRRHLYGHGAFMGAAPALLADERWRRILAFLMPDVYADVSEAMADGADASRLIPMFENNPVMCAYGIWSTLPGNPGDDGDLEAWEYDLLGVEWDLFVDGELARAHERASAEDRPLIADKLLDTAIIAHASTTDTVQEALGVCQWHDVRKTPKTRMGGVQPDAWLDLFARAFELARAEDPLPLLLEMSRQPRVAEGEECTRLTFAEPMPVQRALAVYREVTGRPHFSVVLEIKSLRSTPALLTDLVATLNARGVHVAAVCAFLREEVRGVGAVAQRIGGETLPPPREVQFFHYAGDLQRACDEGEIEAGQSVLFNGASLLHVDDEQDPPVYAVKPGVVEALAVYKARHDLHIGLYVQEGDCDSAAAALLSDLVEHPDGPFDLGFAWGGLREGAALQPGEEARLGYGSQKGLELVGAARQWEL